jgi:hypothetical protein
MQEVLMSTSLRRRGSSQLPLFVRPRSKPDWSDLPTDVQTKILQLVAQFLRQYRARFQAAPEAAREARDE